MNFSLTLCDSLFENRESFWLWLGKKKSPESFCKKRKVFEPPCTLGLERIGQDFARWWYWKKRKKFYLTVFIFKGMYSGFFPAEVFCWKLRKTSDRPQSWTVKAFSCLEDFWRPASIQSDAYNHTRHFFQSFLSGSFQPPGTRKNSELWIYVDYRVTVE